MFFNSKPIQESCKLLFVAVFFCFWLQSCGSAVQPSVQTLVFEDKSVPFQNTSCSTQITLVNSSTLSYTLAFLTATFQDKTDHTFQVQLDQSQMATLFDPITISAGGISAGDVIFDLQGSNLVSPISATVIVIGLSGPQVTHFVGSFKCE